MNCDSLKACKLHGTPVVREYIRLYPLINNHHRYEDTSLMECLHKLFRFFNLHSEPDEKKDTNPTNCFKSLVIKHQVFFLRLMSFQTQDDFVVMAGTRVNHLKLFGTRQSPVYRGRGCCRLCEKRKLLFKSSALIKTSWVARRKAFAKMKNEVIALRICRSPVLYCPCLTLRSFYLNVAAYHFPHFMQNHWSGTAWQRC